MRIKPNVCIDGVRAELVLALIIIDGIFTRRNSELILTECTGGKHKNNSRHYVGLAADIRSKHLYEPEKKIILEEMIASLGDNFDVILENPGAENEHYHMEFDPK